MIALSFLTFLINLAIEDAKCLGFLCYCIIEM